MEVPSPVGLTYNGVTSGVSSDSVTTEQLLEARLGHISSKNFRNFLFISGFLQSVGKSSNPSKISLWCEVFEENSAFVRIARNKSLLRYKTIFLSLSYSPAAHLFPSFSPGQNLAEARAASQSRQVVTRLVLILQTGTKAIIRFRIFCKIYFGILELIFS